MGEYFAAYLKRGKKEETYENTGGLKQLEHCYIGNSYVDYVMSKLTQPARVAWIGDYADDYQRASHSNLTEEEYMKAYKFVWGADRPYVDRPWDYYKTQLKEDGYKEDYPFKKAFLINKDKRCYISMEKCAGYERKLSMENSLLINPLCLLTASYASMYYGINMDKVGSWAFDELQVLSDDKLIPKSYSDVTIDCLFRELYY